MKHIFYSILLFLCIGCAKKTPVFNGDIFIIEDINTVDSLKGIKINIDDIYTGYMSVYDSLMLFVSDKYPDYYLNIFSLNSGKHISSLVKKGGGPNEFTSFKHDEQYVIEGNNIKLWSFDNIKSFYYLNLTSSIQNGKTIIDTVLVQNWIRNHTRPWSYMFMLDDGKFLMRNQPEEYLGNENKNFTLTYYLYHQTTDNELKKYLLYNRIPFEDQKEFDADMLFYSIDRIKPDKSKIAFGLERLAQINILNLQTGKLKGFRLKNTPDFENIKITDENIKNSLKFYYTDIRVSDNNIYALYADCLWREFTDYPFQTNQIHVFDWEGNFTRKIILDHTVSQIAFDCANNLLYTKDENEEIYCYNME